MTCFTKTPPNSANETSSLQRFLIDFAQRGVRQLITELDDGRHLVTSDARLEPVKKARPVKRRISLLDHYCFESLTELGVGNADDGDGVHFGMLYEHIFQLDRIDILAAGDDHVVHSAAQEDVSFVVTIREVAGLDPLLTVCGQIGRATG